MVAGNGYRVIAHDRRGHGRSTQTWDGNEMDTYADDLAVLLDQLDVSGAVPILKDHDWAPPDWNQGLTESRDGWCSRYACGIG
jgi:pimeloyl-ACP methyl ester carboxylesterase